MYIYLVMSVHPVDGEAVVYAYRSEDLAKVSAKLLEEVAVAETTYRVDEIKVEDM